MIIIKTDKEVELIREGGKILSGILKDLEENSKPGIPTDFLDKRAQELAERHGAKPSFKGYRGFPANLCVSINEEVVHCIPGKRVLNEGDIVGLDFGLYYKGYYTDMARTVAIGKISSQAKKLINVTRKSLDIGISKIKPGNHIGDISHAIQKYAESKKFTVVRDLVGHGVGKEVHEPPQIPNYGVKGKGPELKKGMVLAIEPMVNVGKPDIEIKKDGWTIVTSDKSLSCHFEDTVAVTEKGHEILTR